LFQCHGYHSKKGSDKLSSSYAAKVAGFRRILFLKYFFDRFDHFPPFWPFLAVFWQKRGEGGARGIWNLKTKGWTKGFAY
jgi:hypothetical protein